MANSQFIIKVSDILHTPGSKDSIVLESKQSTLLPYPSPTGISAEIEFTGLNDVQLIVEGWDIEATLVHECSRCGCDIEKDYLIPEAETKGLIVKRKDPDKGLDPDIIPIDPKNYIIDVEQRLVDVLVLSMDVQQLCEKCKNNPVEDGSDFVEKSPVIWTQVK